MMKKRLILVDTMAYIFRNFHATFKNGLTNAEGFPTGAIYGFYGAINNLEKRLPDSKIVFVSDMPGNNFRHDMFPEYKANRKPAPEDLKLQIDPIYELISTIGYDLVKVSGVEADDTIASIVKSAESKGLDVVVASGDKDLMSLVSKKTSMLDPKWKIIKEQDVEDKMGVIPSDIFLLLSIVGDAADNVPGLPGAGPKTALKWINEYKTLDGIKENASQIKGKIGEKLRDNLSLIDLSLSLVTLKQDVKFPEIIMDLSESKSSQRENKKLDLFLEKYSIRPNINAT